MTQLDVFILSVPLFWLLTSALGCWLTIRLSACLRRSSTGLCLLCISDISLFYAEKKTNKNTIQFKLVFRPFICTYYTVKWKCIKYIIFINLKQAKLRFVWILHYSKQGHHFVFLNIWFGFPVLESTVAPPGSCSLGKLDLAPSQQP